MKTNKFDYFTAFTEFTDKALAAAETLDTALEGFDSAVVAEYFTKIHTFEHEADGIKHNITEHLSREFVSPIEREDIMSLSDELDNVVDGIDEIIRLVAMFNIRELRDDVLPFTGLLVKECTELRALASEFADFRKSKLINEKLIAVNSIESQADTLHFKAVQRLFSENLSAAGLIAWQGIYNAFEDCFDNCEHVADVMESVILKNS